MLEGSCVSLRVSFSVYCRFRFRFGSFKGLRVTCSCLSVSYLCSLLLSSRYRALWSVDLSDFIFLSVPQKCEIVYISTSFKFKDDSKSGF